MVLDWHGHDLKSRVSECVISLFVFLGVSFWHLVTACLVMFNGLRICPKIWFKPASSFQEFIFSSLINCDFTTVDVDKFEHKGPL